MFRIQPVLPVSASQTFRISSPLSTHFRKGTCEEADCGAYQNGWVTTVPVASQMEATLRASGRSWFARELNPDGTVSYHFAPGTPCFRAETHQVRLDREPRFLVQDGDWRGNPTGIVRVHRDPEGWAENFAEESGRINDLLQKG